MIDLKRTRVRIHGLRVRRDEPLRLPLIRDPARFGTAFATAETKRFCEFNAGFSQDASCDVIATRVQYKALFDSREPNTSASRKVSFTDEQRGDRVRGTIF